ncbi:MAG: transposase [Bryobacter sp.]|nr:transposase [Bryobacter sp. CoA8 C33]
MPEEIVFRTEPLTAVEQIRQAVGDGVPRAPAAADAAYGNDTKFRQALLDMGLQYLVGIQPTLSVWPPGKEPLLSKPPKSLGRPPKQR